MRRKCVWDPTVVKTWAQVRREARAAGKKIHVGRMFGICVEKGSELPPRETSVEHTNIVLCFKAIV